MAPRHRIFDRRRLLVLLSLLLVTGFFSTTLSSYYVSRETIREAIISRELPLTSSNIYSEIQKDLVRPVLISSTMASDTFLRDWVLRGERDVGEMSRYLREVKARFGAFSSFFVSDRTSTYYTGEGILKQVSRGEPRDLWYYRVRQMKEPYEINVDPDLANKDELTIFINYRVFDFNGKYMGATGIGLTVDAVRRLITEYQQRYERTIYFVDKGGRIVLFGNQSGRGQIDLRGAAGIGTMLDDILSRNSGSYQYFDGELHHLLNVHFVPELNWFLFVEKVEEEALAAIRRTLYINLAICLGITLVALLLANFALDQYQRRIEEMATTDKLTGLLNRQAFALLVDRLLADYRRAPQPVSVLLADLDHFKAINDQHGHAAGDAVLRRAGQLLLEALRQSDLAVRWGGEEFLMVLKGCDIAQAQVVAEKLRLEIEQAAFDNEGRAIAVTMSIGVAQLETGETHDQTVKRADAALYAAKQSGRNRVRLAAPGAGAR